MKLHPGSHLPPPCHPSAVASNDDALFLTQGTHPSQAGESSGWRHLYLDTAGLLAEKTWQPQVTSKLRSPSHTGCFSPFFTGQRKTFSRFSAQHGKRHNPLAGGGVSTCQRPSLTSMGRMYNSSGGRGREESEG